MREDILKVWRATKRDATLGSGRLLAPVSSVPRHN
jgi:hypothetical protein